MLVNGKRKWPGALRHRYEELVNSVVNTMTLEHTEIVPHTDTVVGGSGLEPLTSAMGWLLSDSSPSISQYNGP